jgi:hypothetical protein
VVSSDAKGPAELRAEPYALEAPPAAPPPAKRRSGWLDFSIFLFVVLPLGIIAWSAAGYVVLLLLPQIKAALN